MSVDSDISDIVGVLKHFRTYEVSKIKKWIKERLIYSYFSNGKVVGACYIHRIGTKVEIEMVLFLQTLETWVMEKNF